jgi:hypothetical protein
VGCQWSGQWRASVLEYGGLTPFSSRGRCCWIDCFSEAQSFEPFSPGVCIYMVRPLHWLAKAVSSHRHSKTLPRILVCQQVAGRLVVFAFIVTKRLPHVGLSR